ncbi:MAG: TIGR02450 family Trp-rich protein [Gammaproteobacteria bacterium]
MNKFNPKKLLNSKWTAVKPVRKEKHFIVSSIESMDDGTVESISLEAVISKRTAQVDWRELEDSSQWRQGWK